MRRSFRLRGFRLHLNAEDVEIDREGTAQSFVLAVSVVSDEGDDGSGLASRLPQSAGRRPRLWGGGVRTRAVDVPRRTLVVGGVPMIHRSGQP